MTEKLGLTPENADWTLLRQHTARDALILVDAGLGLEDVARAVAADHAVRVGEWIASGRLRKPTREEMERWEKAPATGFRFVIVQPYVLAQEVLAQ
jgi:hypothetical protein